ncbi:hypothetical protein K474DRAFT_1445426 [Panus rudis PR-1116 ss-1]|nr:hypothetical protein K474DRAFT_1445426 [Panus rudis PR-1116 ss-1]
MPLFERSGWSISVHSHRGRKNEFNLRFTTENDRAECNIEYEHNREFWIIVERRQTGSSDVYVRITLDGVEYDHFIFPRQDTEWISEGWQSADGSVFPYMWRPAKAMSMW